MRLAEILASVVYMISGGYALLIFLELVFLIFLFLLLSDVMCTLSVCLPVAACWPPSDLLQAQNQFAKLLKNGTRRTKGHVSYKVNVHLGLSFVTSVLSLRLLIISLLLCCSLNKVPTERVHSRH